MNAVRSHARLRGNTRAPVFSPWNVMLADGNASQFVENRQAPPPGSGLAPAASDVFDVGSLKRAGYQVVTWTVNDKPRMLELLKLGVDGIISDRPDLLREAVAEFDQNGDGKPGDLLGADGLVDTSKFDAQGHRGARNLRPENTLPAMEAALDNLMTTLETDTGVSLDNKGVLNHDPYIESQKCRRADGAPYESADEVLVKNLAVAQIQSTYVCDKLFRGPTQSNELSLSPVAVAFTASRGINAYAMPTLQQLFEFVTAYVAFYKTGSGKDRPEAELRWKNAERVRFNIETKLNPRTDADDKGTVFATRTVAPEQFVAVVGGTIAANGLQVRADVQSFDFRTLLEVHERFPAIRTVFLFGDFPKYADPALAGSDDGTNLQPQGGPNTPWLAGLPWPYRVTALSHPFLVQRSGGFEGMALTSDGRRLLPMLEKPLVGADPQTLLVHELNLATGAYSSSRWAYRLDPRGRAIGDFTAVDRRHALVIERDDSQGDLNGFKAVYEVVLGEPGGVLEKRLVADLLNIHDPHRISEPPLPGDVGIGVRFAFPFTTIESVVVLDRRRIGVVNDNNFPFSVGRHVGQGKPDDTEFVILRLGERLG